MKVYLAGPIAGLSWEAATAWRIRAKKQLNANGIEAYSPLRGREFEALKGTRRIQSAHNAPHGILRTSRGVTTSDRFTLAWCDLVVLNLLYTSKVSIGSMVEIGWADANRIPLVVAMVEGNIHDHPFVRECAGYIVEDVDDAIDVAVTVLNE